MLEYYPFSHHSYTKITFFFENLPFNVLDRTHALAEGEYGASGQAGEAHGSGIQAA